MKDLACFQILILLVCGCASPELVRVTGPRLRVSIHPQSVSVPALRVALVRSKAFQVIESPAAVERDPAGEGAGEEPPAAPLIPLAPLAPLLLLGEGNCQLTNGFKGYFYHCRITLTLFDSRTNEVLAAAEDSQEAELDHNPSWDKAVQAVLAQLREACPQLSGGGCKLGP